MTLMKLGENIVSYCSHVATIWRYFRFAGFQASIDLSADSPKNYYVDVGGYLNSVCGSEFEENDFQLSRRISGKC